MNGARGQGLMDRLRSAVGERHVLTGDLVAGYDQDWTGRWRGEPLAVVRPGSTEEVSAVIVACAAAGVALVPQGGNTGLVGAAAPADGEVVLSTTRLRAAGVPDPGSGTIETGAGAALAAVQDAARAGGLELGVDVASRGTATIGGVLATNAGGARVLRHGTTRAQVLGIEAVLADGSVVTRMNGLPKDNTGYDLVQLLVGSEGTLGVLTRAVLRLSPRPPARAAALLALADADAAVTVAASLRAVPGLDAMEFYTAAGLELVLAAGRARAPFADAAPVHVLAEAVGPDADELSEALALALDDAPGLLDAALATSETDRAQLWALRESHTEVLAPLEPVKLDVAVPLAALPAFLDRLTAIVDATAPGVTPVPFGHLAEGNVHVNLPGAAPFDKEGAVTDAVLTLVAELGGSISAEHGIGRAKRRWLHLGRSDADIAAMRAIKRALDPAGLLSPGRLLPDD
jgi:FAD/FMN-containing dehydrogenase